MSPGPCRSLGPMEPTALTIVSQLIVDAQTRHGAAAVRRLDVDPDLLDDCMDAVLALGGRVGLDWCEVDRVEIHGLPPDQSLARAWLHGDDEPHPLTPIED
jgi:hypothetical protein